jgi:transposase
LGAAAARDWQRQARQNGRPPAEEAHRALAQVGSISPAWFHRRDLDQDQHGATARLGTIDGPINGERFRLYGEKVPLPTLRPSDIVVMDNLGSHRGKALRRAIRSVGVKLFFLPKYSPDLNPIEQLFAKLNRWLRHAAKRTSDAVCNAIGHILGSVSSAECRNYFVNPGYEPT